MNTSTLSTSPSITPRRVVSPQTGLNAQLLLNRLAAQLEQVRYLAADDACDVKELRAVVAMLKMAYGLAFKRQEMWSRWILPQAVASHAIAKSSGRGSAGSYFMADLADVNVDRLDEASSLIDEAADRLLWISKAISDRVDGAPNIWVD